MILLIVNSSGNVGKSTLVKEVFAPSLASATIVEVESINKGNEELASDADYLQSNDMREVYAAMAMADNVVVDIGASNINAFFDFMGENTTVAERFDKFVIPCVPDDKQIADSGVTASILKDVFKINPEKIFFIPNRVNPKEVAERFRTIEAYASDIGANYSSDVYLSETSIFQKLQEHKTTLKELLDDERDFFQLAKEHRDDKAAFNRYVDLDMLRGAAVKLRDEIEKVRAFVLGDLKPSKSPEKKTGK